MEKSNSIQNLTKALGLFHAQKIKIGKDGKNPFFKSEYATLPHILKEIAEPMESAGLVISMWPEGEGLTTLLIHAESGEYILSNFTLHVVRQNDPQAHGSAISYARRQVITSILNLAISDDDAEAATKILRQPAAKPAAPKVEALPAPTEEQFAGIVKYLNGDQAQQRMAREALKRYSFSQDQKDTLDGLI